jgi:hypothetical protein
MTSARVSGEKSEEELDQLDRSKKKPKTSDNTQDTVVSETQMMDVLNQDSGSRENNEVSQRKKVSYKDICMNFNGGGQDHGEPEEEWWFEQDDATDAGDMEDEDPRLNQENTEESLFIPIAKVTKEEIREACNPWKRAIVVKLLGKRLSLNIMRTRLMKMWAPTGEMEIIDLENDYFLIRLEDRADVTRVFEGGPWLIMGHHLVIHRWHPEFFPKEDELKRVAV